MPPKIALLIHALNGGGAERLMSQLAARWSTDYQIHLVTWASADSDRYALPPSVHRYGLNLQTPSTGLVGGLRANLKRTQRLRKQLRAIAPDFVLSFSDQMNIVALEAARPLGKPVWIAEHSDPAKQQLSRLWEAWRARTYPTCTGCVALTSGIAEFMQRWINADRLRVIPPAVAPPMADQSSSALSKPQAKSFLFVGRLSREKGVDVLVEAWRRVHSRLPDWKLLIAGDGDQREALQRQAETLASVEFLGWTDHPWGLYQQADCFVLPSRYEGFPVALLEAMSQGNAAIATRCSTAIDEIAAEDQVLLTVATESPSALGGAMMDIAANEPLRQRLGSNAKAFAASYSWDKIGPRWDELLGGVGAPGYSLKR